MASFTWSYSQLKNFETCPKRHYHYDVAKDVAGETYQQGEGHETHKAFEDYMRSGKSLPLGLKQHDDMMAKLRSLSGEIYAEQKLALTAEFKPTGFFDKRVWFRTVVDFCNVQAPNATVIDYKTGRPAEDKTQLALLSATVLHYLPEVKQVRARLFFVNHNHVEKADYKRRDLTGIWNEILPRVKKLQRAREQEEYPPTPSGLCVRYCGVTSCPYHGRGTR